MKRFKLAICVLLFFVSLNLNGQSESQIREQYVIASDNMTYDYYEKAAPALHWLLKNSPEYSKNTHQMAIRAFEELAKVEPDKQRKSILLDSMLFAYESKKIHHGLTILDKNKLAFRYFRYFKNDKQKLPVAFELFQEVFGQPESAMNNNLVPYMYITKLYHEDVSTLDQNTRFRVYSQVQDLIASKIKNESSAERMIKYREQVDRLFAETLINDPLSCELVSQLSSMSSAWDPTYFSKRVLAFSLESKCGNSPEFIASLELLAQSEPSPGILKILARFEASQNKFEKAIAYYKEVVSLESSNIKQSSAYFEIAKLYYLWLNKPEARQYAFRALELNSESASMIYSFIGNLYMDSFDECAEQFDIVQDRAVFMAAYDMFEKANDKEGMNRAKEQFPTRSQAFTSDMYDGDEIQVGCWINLKTTLRTLPSN